MLLNNNFHIKQYVNPALNSNFYFSTETPSRFRHAVQYTDELRFALAKSESNFYPPGVFFLGLNGWWGKGLYSRTASTVEHIE